MYPGGYMNIFLRMKFRPDLIFCILYIKLQILVLLNPTVIFPETSLCQPEVSTAMMYLEGREWGGSRGILSEKKGRPAKLWNLALPFVKIRDTTGNENDRELIIPMDMAKTTKLFPNEGSFTHSRKEED